MKFKGVTIVTVSVIAIFIDRFCKFLAEQAAAPFGARFFGFEPYHNFGIAFGLPVRPLVAVPLTVIFLTGLWVYAKKEQRALLVPIFFGAISNLCDRIFFGYTVDYIRILYSIINLADLLVLGGLILFIIQQGGYDNKTS